GLRPLPPPAVAARGRGARMEGDAGGRAGRRRGPGGDLRLPQPRLPARDLRAEAGARTVAGRDPGGQCRARLQRTPWRPRAGHRHPRGAAGRGELRSHPRVRLAARQRRGLRLHHELPARQPARDRLRALALGARPLTALSRRERRSYNVGMNDTVRVAFHGFEQIPLREYAERAYLDYSMYVVLDRALPFIEIGRAHV